MDNTNAKQTNSQDIKTSLNRRDFIRTTGAATMGMAVSPGVAFKGGTNAAPKIRVGIVGGNFGSNQIEKYDQPQWWKTEMLPKPLRHDSGHDGSHTFITHEFIDALVNDRKPEVDIHEALAYTAPGIVGHESALKGGEYMKIPDFDD